MLRRVYITGPSGAGVSTLGAALAERLGAVHLDTDSFYWEPTDPPFAIKRPVPERIALIQAAQKGAAWVLSGSLEPWGEAVLRDVERVVYLTAPADLRVARLREREARRHGKAIEPGGPMHDKHAEFIEWAAQYDEGRLAGRSRARHEIWLAEITWPVLRLDGAERVADLVDQVIAAPPR